MATTDDGPGDVCLDLRNLTDVLGVTAAEALLACVDPRRRHGRGIDAVTTLEAATLTPVASGRALVVVPDEGRDDVGGMLVVMTLGDLAAVVRHARKPFDWCAEFAPRPGLPAATTSPVPRTGSRGRRSFAPTP